MNAIRNRIVDHKRLPASCLKPHPQNPRTHPDEQRSVLRGLLADIGLARSVLAYVDEEWGLTLIDGHLLQEELGDEEVEVEILDVTRAEAEQLLLAIDPLAALAGYDASTLASLREVHEKDSAAIASLWEAIEEANKEASSALAKAKRGKQKVADLVECFQVLVECKDEKEQVALLRRFKREGLTCKALIS